MLILTVLYHAPKDPVAFEAYYAATHLPLVAKIEGIAQSVLIKCAANADGSPPAYYRIAQLFFASAADMATGLGSTAGQAAVADMGAFADGGVTVVTGETG